MNPLTSERPINVASVPHRSPFRYPGGKTWFVPFARRWLATRPKRPSILCEPFAGGAIVGLSALFEGRVDHLILVELDEDVAAVWKAILEGGAEELTEQIRGFRITDKSVRELLAGSSKTLLQRAFVTLVKNRVNRGGILAPGASLMKLGENGRGVASRWYPDTLRKRISAIAAKRDQITFVHGDGIQCLRDQTDKSDVAFFIDPPYTIAGRRLYLYSDVDHPELFGVVSRVRGDFLMTYDEAEPIRNLAQQFKFDTHTVLMKNTHHRVMRELLVGRDLTWISGSPGQLGQDSLFELS